MRIPFIVLGLCLGTTPAFSAPAKQAPGIRGELPSSAKIQEALGEASKALARQRDELLEEKRRLELLKEEIRGEIKRLQDIQKSLKTPMQEKQAKLTRLNPQPLKMIEDLTKKVPQALKWDLDPLRPKLRKVATTHFDWKGIAKKLWDNLSLK